tara:strand:+ start:375 stop:1217 length:843 start_codon:yes stop_codon:yes gene_type:complete
MAKKQTTKKVEVEQPEMKATNEMKQVVIEKPQLKKKTGPEDSWKIKDRIYHLKGKTPLSSLIKGSNIYYFDEEKGYERELKHTSNQKTCFVDEMQGDQRLEHIIFRNGNLSVPKNKVTLQKLLSLYHPLRGLIYEEHKPSVIAENQVDMIELELAALNAAVDLDIDMAEAVMRVEIGSKVTQMSSKELKRDLLVYAKRNPGLFLDLVEDENVMLRNFGIRATEMGIIKLSSDQRTFKWGTNDRKLCTVPFDEHPYSALAAWFKTDEGMEIYSNIEKRFNA